MTWRLAIDSDLPGLLVLLREHEAGSMFPLARLATAGLGGEGPHAMEVWLAEAGGRIAGMVGLSRAGMILPQMPGADWAGVRDVLVGRRISGVIGQSEQVRPLMTALGLDRVIARHDGDESGFTLDLHDLVLPKADAVLVRPGSAERALMIGWRAAYLAEIFATPMPEAVAQAPADVDRWLVADSHRLLAVAGVVVAMSGFNARLPDVVQIGGVYTPRYLRRRGYARQVVARHLAEARDSGVARAVLFAVSPHAIRAYRAIGFREKGTMALVLYAAPQEVQAWA